MKKIKSALMALSLILTAQAVQAECVRNTEELAKNSSRTIPDFLRKLPARFANDDNSVRFSIQAPLRKYYDKKTGQLINEAHPFRGRWDANSLGGGDLYAAKICIEGSTFRMELEDGSKFSAELSGNNFIFKKFFKSYVLSPK